MILVRADSTNAFIDLLRRTSFALSMALLAACGKPPEEILTVHLDLAESLARAEVRVETLGSDLLASELHLGAGWSPREKSAERWSLSEASEAVFHLLDPRPVEVVATARPFVFPGAPEQTLTIEVNTQPVATLTLARGRETYRVPVPATVLEAGENRLRFAYGYHRAPSDVLGTDDGRSLAVAWSRLAVADPSSPRETPAAVQVDGRRLVMPAGSQVDYYMRVGPRTEMTVTGWNPRGARLEARWQPQDAGETLLATVDSADHSPRLSLPAGSGEVMARLRLRSLGIGVFVLEEPRILSTPRAVSGAPAPASRVGKPKANVLVYMIDTVRADHLSCYGYERPTSPHIDAFAAEAVLFEDAVAQSSWTRSSVASLLTGLSPTEHGALRRNHKLPEETLGLAEILQEAGWETAAFVTNPNVTPVFGFDQGFSHFDDLGESASATEVNVAVFEWLEQREDAGRPFFLYVHTMDPHDPYEPPPELAARFLPSPFASPREAQKALNDFQSGRWEVEDHLLEGLRALYDAEIAANDRAFGELVDFLEHRDLHDDTWIVVVSDHGEEFHDHGHFRHGKALFEESVGVPLIVKPPGSHQGRRIVETVQHVDVLPTLLAELGLDVPEGLHGRHLLAPLEATPIISYLHLDGAPRASVLERGWKLIVRRDGERLVSPRLFHLPSDPAEQEDLAAKQPIRVGYLSALLRQHLLAGRASEETELDAGLRRRLEALGYVE